MGGDGGGTRRRQRAIAKPQIIAVLSLRRKRAGGQGEPENDQGAD
jgi:hypothetical protein